MLFGMELSEVIRAIGVLGIAAIVFAESGMMIGFFLPGDTLLFTAGFLAQQGVLGINVNFLIAILFVAAFLGDNFGYLFGQKVGRKLFKKPDSLLFRQENLKHAENFYEKYGKITVIIAKFIPVVRTFAPVVAGVGNMQYKTYIAFDVLGCFLWTSCVTYLGFFGGAFLESKGINVEALILPVIALAVLASAASPLIQIIKDPKSRKMFLQRFKAKKSDS